MELFWKKVKEVADAILFLYIIVIGLLFHPSGVEPDDYSLPMISHLSNLIMVIGMLSLMYIPFYKSSRNKVIGAVAGYFLVLGSYSIGIPFIEKIFINDVIKNISNQIVVCLYIGIGILLWLSVYLIAFFKQE